MGYELRREVRAVLPPGKLTPLERLLILEIADQCGDDTRRGFPGAELLALLIDRSERTVEETLKGIATKWTELRVPLGKGADGRPYYSHRRVRTTFEFPKPAELRALFTKATGMSWASSPLASLPGAIPTRKPPKKSGASDEKPPQNPGASGGKPPGKSEKAPEFSGESPRVFREKPPEKSGALPSSFPQGNPQTPPPYPPTDGTAPPAQPGAEEGGKGDFPSDQEQRIKTLTDAMRQRRPGDPRWRPVKIREAITACLADGKTLDEVEHAFPLCEADPDTGSPGRLPLPFGWWPMPKQVELGPDDQEQCSHPYHADLARNCSSCRSEALCGQDPFVGYENLRPDWWATTYLKAPRRPPNSLPAEGDTAGWSDWVAAKKAAEEASRD